MSIGRIGYYGNAYGIGSLYNRYGMNNVSSLYRRQINSVNRVNSLSKYGYSNINRYLESSSASFMKDYNTSMSELMTGSNALRSSNRSGLWNKTDVSSSDQEVMDVVQNYTMSSKDTYKVNVNRLATGQRNVSEAVNAKDAAESDAAFSISTGRGSFSFNISAADSDGNIKTNGDLLKEMAAEVNRSDIGIKAAVETKDGMSQISFTSEKTGADSSFKIEGDFAEKNGFDKITEEAADAEYTVAKNGQDMRTYNSASNNVSLDYGRIDATLKTEGESTVSVGVNNDKVVSSVKDMVKKYNNTIDMLNENKDRGYGVERQLNNMRNLPVTEKSLNEVGITKDSDGKLRVDEDKLFNSLTSKPDLTKEVLGGSFGLSQALFDNGRQGLAQSSSSLLQNDFSRNQQTGSTNQMFNIMSLYNRSGIYSMSNLYSVGSFLNLLV